MAGAINTPAGILSYPHLATPQKALNPEQKDKYGITLVFPKGTDLSALEAAARAVVIEALGEAKGKAFALFGGEKKAFRTDLGEKYPNIEGPVVISARGVDQPGMVYREADPASVTAENPKGKPKTVAKSDVYEVFYAGAMVRAQVKPYYYDKGVNKGLGWALNNVQKMGEGERLDNRDKAEDAFDADMAAAPASIEGLV